MERFTEGQDKAGEEKESVIKNYFNTDTTYRTDSGNSAFYDTCSKWVEVESGE